MIHFKKQSKADRIYHAMLERLQKMADGDEFPSVRQIMREFEVSQFSVQPVFERLQEEGLIRSRVGSGSLVNHIKNTSRVRLVLLTTSWPSYTIFEFVDEFTEQARLLNYTVNHINFDYHLDPLTMLGSIRDADLIVCVPNVCERFTAEQVSLIKNSKVPVLICRYEVPVQGIPYVAGNSAIGGGLIANYLAKTGHRKIGILYGEPHDYVMRNLLNGFNSAAGVLGLEIEMLDCKTNYGENALDNVQAYLRNYLASRRTFDFTCLFVTSDGTAVAALDVLQEEGWQVPNDLSVIGFGNVKIRGRYENKLTTVGEDTVKLVKAAMRLAQDMVEGKTEEDIHITITPEIFERFTVKRLI